MIATKDNDGNMFHHNQDPYIENEPISEVGYAMEFLYGGGCPKEMIGDKLLDNGIPPLGFFRQMIWPTEEHAHSSDLFSGPKLLDPKPETFQQLYPIHARLFEDMHQEDFYDVCRRYSVSPLEMRPIHVGSQYKLLRSGFRYGAFTREIVETSMLQQKLNAMNLDPKARKIIGTVGPEILETASLGMEYCKCNRELFFLFLNQYLHRSLI